MSLINLRTASGDELDTAGDLMGVGRDRGEPDSSYRDKLLQVSMRAVSINWAENYPQSADKVFMASDATLRDYFAAKAIQGMFANDALLKRYAEDGMVNMVSPEVLATTAAYSIADAMLAERAK